MTVIRLERIDFDSMENHNPTSTRTIGIFVPDGTASALGKVSQWFTQQQPIQLYVGYDGEVYPQFRLHAEQAK